MELSRVSDKLKLSKASTMEEIQTIAELTALTGYYVLGDLLGASAARRDHFRNLLLARSGAGARIMRQI